MLKYLLLFPVLLAGLSSCKITDEDKSYADTESTTYHLRLRPDKGSRYYYDINNSTSIRFEVEGKETESENATEVGMTYDISGDSSGNYLFTMKYDRAHVSTKNGETKTEADAQNASFSGNMVDKMLGALKEATLVASVSPDGEITIVSGYKELTDQLMLYLNTNDSTTRDIARKQLDKIIGEGMIRKNIDQLFKMFPDSAIRVGDKWKIDSRQNGDFNFRFKTSYRLKEISEGIALIDSESEIVSESLPIAMLGYSVIPDLKGSQEGEYEMEAETGMLRKATVNSDIEGSIQLAGKQVPIRIKMKVEIEGKKLK
jgi:hypothetical protein